MRLCCRSPSELKSELRKTEERLRDKREFVRGCISQSAFEPRELRKRSARVMARRFHRNLKQPEQARRACGALAH
jgi:hypothetical protein